MSPNFTAVNIGDLSPIPGVDPAGAGQITLSVADICGWYTHITA